MMGFKKEKKIETLESELCDKTDKITLNFRNCTVRKNGTAVPD